MNRVLSLVCFLVIVISGGVDDPRLEELVLHFPLVTGKIGIIGDSIGTATHTEDSCGSGRELMDCIEDKLGSSDPDWSFMAGSQSWSIARRIGYSAADILNASMDGEQWKDALDQAESVVGYGAHNVVVHMGSNDVCNKYGHKYGTMYFRQMRNPNDILLIEAEHFISRAGGVGDTWEPEKISGTRNGVAMVALPDDGHWLDASANGPRLDFPVLMKKSGTYYVWIRGYAKDNPSDTVHVGLDYAYKSSSDKFYFSTKNAWIWNKTTLDGPATLYVSAGTHTLNVFMREDGFKIDKILLTTSSSYVPGVTETLPPENPRGLVINNGGGRITIEAEHYHHQTKSADGYHRWQVDYLSGSSGSALRAIPNDGLFTNGTNAARLDYPVYFTSKGTYYVWVRGYATGTDDTVHVGLNGTLPTSSDKIYFPSKNAWTWSKATVGGPVATINVTGYGDNMINVWMREDGFVLDKIVLTQSSSYVPSGKGEKEVPTGDLAEVLGHINDTMLYLTKSLPAGGGIYWPGIIDIPKFRDMMVNRDHNYALRKCRYLWDLDISSDTLYGDAKNSLCKREFNNFCDYVPDRLLEELLDRYLAEVMEQFPSSDNGPCGRVLDSRNTQADRDEAGRFNKALNDVMEYKARQFDGLNSVNIYYTQSPWYMKLKPFYISHLDCFHPNRAGQLRLAQATWQGLFGTSPTDRYRYADFADSNWWTDRAYTWWPSDWYEGGSRGTCGDEFICDNDNGWLQFGKEWDNNVDHWLARDIGNWSSLSGVWAYFKHKRDGFDDDSDWVRFQVYNGSGWVTLKKYEKNEDVGVHASEFFNLTAYKNSAMKFRFLTNNDEDMKDGDKLMIDDLLVFGW